MDSHQLLLALHLLAISFGVGIGFSSLVNMRVSRGQTGEAARGLALHRMAMRPYSDVFVAAIVVTGLLLLWMRGGTTGLPVWFHVKMAAVVVLVLGYVGVRLTVRQLMKTGDMSLVKRLSLLSHSNMTAAVVAIVCAVLAFS